MRPSTVKQILIVRKDLGMRKMVAQGAHAGAAFLLTKITSDQKLSPVELLWAREGHTRICVGAASEAELLDTVFAALHAGLTAHVIKDEGLTEVPAGTVTAAAIGPATAEQLAPLTGQLKRL